MKLRVKRVLFWGVSLFSIMTLFSACKANKEDLMKWWSNTEAEATKYQQTYPAFADVIKTTHAKYKTDFDAAAKGKGDIAKMKAAYRGLSDALKPIEKYEEKRARIKKLYNDYHVRKNRSHKVEKARAKADRKLEASSALVAAATHIKTLADLNKPFNEANILLDEALRHLEKLKRKGKKNKRKKRKKERR